MRFAMLRDVDDFVVNVIEYELGGNWQPPEGHYLMIAGDASPGDTWDGSKFVKPEPPIPELPISYSCHFGIITSIDMSLEKPIRCNCKFPGDVWVEHDCYITEWIREYYVEGHKLEAGDWVLVNFIENDVMKPMVFEKVFVSW